MHFYLHLAYNILLICLPLVIISILVYKFFRRKYYVSRHFAGHVNSDVLNVINHNTNRIKLHGEKKVITVLFLDIEGFTSLSENMSNEEVVKMLNKYFLEISSIIFRHNGTVDKYMGDGVMAFWGAPLLDKYQALNAVYAAMDIREFFEDEPVKVRVGINTGEVLVGSIGNDDMASYTAIGDSVNVASRLESLNKNYGTSIIFSKTTKNRIIKELSKTNENTNGHIEEIMTLSEKTEKERLYDQFSSPKSKVFWREIDKVRVYGKHDITYLYELIGDRSDLDKDNLDGYEYFEVGLAYYRKGDWGEAEDFFRKSLKRLKEDSVSETFIKRCRSFQEEPPVGRWNGTVNLGK